MDAQIEVSRDEHVVHYRSVRTHRGEPPAELDVTYHSQGDPFETQPGSIEHWLTARYCLYCQGGKRIYRGEILHPPWRLQPATCEIRRNTMVDWLDLSLPNEQPLLHYSDRIDVVVWSNDRVH